MPRTSDIGLNLTHISDTTGRVWAERLDIDPGVERTPRDQAALLLTVVAEIEHALMVQYLYSAYSIRDGLESPERSALARGIKTRLLQISREEMGHLITVQNLLHLIGAAPHFHRENSPFESDFYPFRFKLEALSSGSLAKYVTAESPGSRPPDFDDEAWAKVLDIADEARASNDGQRVRHVGAIFELLIKLFEDPASGVQDIDFVLASAPFQARYDDWGYDPGMRGDTSRQVMVEAFTSADANELRQGSVAALREIAEQGEGAGMSTDSHFERFLELYDDFNALQASGPSIARSVATNPLVRRASDLTASAERDLVGALQSAAAENGEITHPRSWFWGALLNLRYRLLLDFLAHYLRRDDENYIAEGPDIGNRTKRGFLLIWAFDQMRHVKKIAEKLVQMPLSDPDDGRFAGPPFQLPYTLALPEAEASRWRVHADVMTTSRSLIARMRQQDPEAKDPFLEDLAAWDNRVGAIVHALARGDDIPESAHPKDFRKVVIALEEAVRGFSIDVHENFWSGKTRDEFVAMHMFNNPIINSDPSDSCKFTPRNSQLIGVLSRSMPRFRPTISRERLAYIEDWIDRQAPDNTPVGEIGLRHERAPDREPVAPKADLRFAATPGNAPDYHRDIAPLFRKIDVHLVQRMTGINLADANDVARNAQRLLADMETGVLPYDGSWSMERILLFRAWAESREIE